jgi:hypothetical protein
MNENRYAPPNAPVTDSSSSGSLGTLIAAIRNVNLQRISKYAMCLFLVESICGIMQVLLLTPSLNVQVEMNRIIASAAVTLLVSAAIFFTLSSRHIQNQWLQATQVLALYTAMFLACGWLLGMWLDVSSTVLMFVELFVEWLVLLIGAVLGTGIGTFLVRRRARRSIEA